jgi:hypothetical protein
MAADVIAPSLTEIFAKSIHTGIFPDEWKEARVSPVYRPKNGAKHEPSNSTSSLVSSLRSHM